MGGGEAFARSSSIKERWLFVLRVGHDFFFLGEGIADKGYDLCATPRCYSFLPSRVSFIFL